MAKVTITSIQQDMGAGLAGQSLFPIWTKEATKRFKTIKADGTKGSATEAIGIVASDTGDFAGGGYGLFEANEVVRTIRDAWVEIQEELSVGAKIYLGEDGELDTTGTVAVGVVLRTPVNDGADKNTQAYIHFGELAVTAGA